MRDQGFEPWTPWLRVRCSASWANRAYLLSQAGDGNRTHVFSLEGWCSTIEPHPHINTNISQSGWQDSNLRPPGPKPGALAKLSHTPKYKFKKPMIGLEPITCWLQISCSANWATSAYINSPSRTRTYDNSVNSRVLYQLSYWGLFIF